MRKLFQLLALTTITVCTASAYAQQTSGPAPTPGFPTGVVIPKVVVEGTPEQSYALYLPAKYTPAKAWPIMFAFDPEAQGQHPVELLKEAAEKFGYIVAGSNNSRNGNGRAQMEAAQAMWNDAHRKLSIDPQRVYATGFSGGARVASVVALRCGGCIAGVVAHGAGFPSGVSPTKDTKFIFFGAIGEGDFNYPEMIDLGNMLEKAEVPNRIRRFSGGHQWAPAPVWHEALGWLDLWAMKKGSRKKDDAVIAEMLKQDQARAEGLKNEGKEYFAFQEYQRLIRDYEGVADVGSFREIARQLENSKPVKSGAKREREEDLLQQRITVEISTELLRLEKEPADRASTLARLNNLMAALKKKYDKAKGTSEENFYRRAMGQVVAQAYESGFRFFAEKDYPLAILYYELLLPVVLKPGPLFIEIAQAQVRAGDKKAALKSLKQAVASGLSEPEKLRDPDFAVLKENPEYQALLDSAAHSKAP
jgi:hypothetical protein